VKRYLFFLFPPFPPAADYFKRLALFNRQFVFFVCFTHEEGVPLQFAYFIFSPAYQTLSKNVYTLHIL